VATILCVATTLFLKQGYARTSLNDVVARAGGSKATLRKYFRNKAGLFSAVIADVSARFVADAHLRELAGNPEQVLRKFGETVLRFYLAQDSLTAYRTVVAEGHGSRMMARSFYEQGHKLVQAALAERLDAWNRDGAIATENAFDAADLFCT
jgi:TetR/AcrR family transcriptional repressor of cmeABC operon